MKETRYMVLEQYWVPNACFVKHETFSLHHDIIIVPPCKNNPEPVLSSVSLSDLQIRTQCSCSTLKKHTTDGTKQMLRSELLHNTVSMGLSQVTQWMSHCIWVARTVGHSL